MPTGNEFNFVQIIETSEIQDGEFIALEISDLPIVLYKVNGDFFATGDVCTHDSGTISDGRLEGFEVVCPRHGARFDIRDGKVKRLPAARDIPHYPTKVENGFVFIGIPE